MEKTKRVAAGEFKAKCLQIMQEMQRDKKPVIITKRGRPLAKLMPIEAVPEDPFGCMRGSVRIVGDIISPVEVDWDANTP